MVIIGNAAAARECWHLAHEMAAFSPDLRCKGFLSFEGHPGNLRELRDRQLGVDDDYRAEADDVFVIGIAQPALRAKAYAKWKARGARFLTLRHPCCLIAGSVRMGEGNIIAHSCSFSCDVTIGDANFFNGSITVGHDVAIGDANFLGPFSLILGEAAIGSGNSLGARSVLLAGARIGSGNTIAPGAYVYKGCGDHCLMAGNPALRVD